MTLIFIVQLFILNENYFLKIVSLKCAPFRSWNSWKRRLKFSITARKYALTCLTFLVGYLLVVYQLTADICHTLQTKSNSIRKCPLDSNPGYLVAMNVYFSRHLLVREKLTDDVLTSVRGMGSYAIMLKTGLGIAT